jgi:hypothetical protein
VARSFIVRHKDVLVDSWALGFEKRSRYLSSARRRVRRIPRSSQQRSRGGERSGAEIGTVLKLQAAAAKASPLNNAALRRLRTLALDSFPYRRKLRSAYIGYTKRLSG